MLHRSLRTDEIRGDQRFPMTWFKSVKPAESDSDRESHQNNAPAPLFSGDQLGERFAGRGLFVGV